MTREKIELMGGCSIFDLIYRAGKSGWADASDMIKIHKLRNLIAHEYATGKMPEIYSAVAAMSPTYLAVVPKSIADAGSLIQRYPE